MQIESATRHGMTIADYARMYAALGLRPIRIAPGAKRPMDEGWTALALLSPNQAADAFRLHSGNIGLALPAGVVVIDCDTTTPGGGMAALEAYASQRGTLPDTLTQVTQSGGRHLLYRLPAGYTCSNRVKVLPGVDVRTLGGQIVVEPSTIEGRPYVWEDWDVSTGELPDLAELPSWLYGLLGVQHASQQLLTMPPRPVLHPDTPIIVEGGRNDALFRMACSLRRRGASEAAILQALEAINASDCRPPLDASEVATIAASASRYAPEPITPALPDTPAWVAVAPPVEAYGEEPPSLEEQEANRPPLIDSNPRARMNLVAAGEIPTGRILIPAGLIEDVLPDKGIAMGYGPSNCGKTFVALDMACAIARGIPWRDKATKQCAVLYIASESAISVVHRVKAYKDANGVDSFPLYVAQKSININAPGTDDDIIEACAMIEAETGQRAGMIVVDTLSSSMPGCDENDSGDMSNTMARLQRVQLMTDTLMMLVHHAGKDLSRGARGWSGLRAWVDTEVAISEGNDDGVHTVEVTKHRTMSGRGERYGFTLQPIPIGVNEWGREVATCVVVECDAPPKEGAELPAPLPTPESVAREVGREQGIEAFILDYLRNHGPSVSQATITREAEGVGITKGAVSKVIHTLACRRKLWKQGRVVTLR